MSQTIVVAGAIPLGMDAELGNLPPVHINEPITITIFGATGDLAHRKLIPALFALFSQGIFREKFALLGFARRNFSEGVFREQIREAVKTFSHLPADHALLDDFIGRVYYHQGDLNDPSTYAALKSRLGDRGTFPPNHIFYLAVTPDLFMPVIERLNGAGLFYDPYSKPWSRVVIEKPFGRNSASARRLNLDVLALLDETQIYRIDHYLGKETVQNILGFRLANWIFEPLLNNQHVDHIQITASETVGMESGRGAYYDSAGALRDMIQNHLLQLLSLVTMEPPSNLTADVMHTSKVQLLRALAPPEKARHYAIRARYGAGQIDNQPVPAYIHEDRIARDSRTESYCALRLSIDNWRWAGVPVYLRTGKRLKKRLTEVVLQFKQPPLKLFKTVECLGDVCDLTLSRPNLLIFRIQPDEGISLQFSAKRPAMQFVVQSVAMDFCYKRTWHKSLPEAYERLLLDVMRGDSTLFTRSDEVDAAWRVVDPILNAWTSQPDMPLHYYPPGSWGPEAADALIQAEGRTWRNPD